MFVVGAIDVYSLRSSFSRGTDGDGILSVSAPGTDVTVAKAYTAGYVFKEGTSQGKYIPSPTLSSGYIRKLIN